MLAQTLADQQEQDGEDASGSRGGALLADDSDADADMEDDDDRPPSRTGSGMNASTSVCGSSTICVLSAWFGDFLWQMQLLEKSDLLENVFSLRCLQHPHKCVLL